MFVNTTVDEIEHIKEMLPKLSEPALIEVRDFIRYIFEKQKKRKAFVDRVLKTEKETPIRFRSVKEAMQAIRDEAGI
jgi:hypothetical protein